jgi:hypothetical protein
VTLNLLSFNDGRWATRRPNSVHITYLQLSVKHLLFTIDSGSSNPTYRHEMRFLTHFYTLLMFKLFKLGKKNCVFFFQKLPDNCKTLLCLNVHRLRPLVLLNWVLLTWGWILSITEIILTERNDVPGEKPVTVPFRPP